MRRFTLVLGLVLALLATIGTGGVARGATSPDQAAQAALGWLLARQQDDGSFPGFDAGASVDAIFAITAVGSDPNGVLKNGNSPVSYLGTQAGGYATKSPAAAGKLVLGVVAAGKDPRSFGGQNLIKLLYDGYDAKTGRFGAQTTDQVYALLALAATGQTIPPGAIPALQALQLPDGGWSFDGNPATGSDTNTTALAIQALVATRAGGDMLPKAVAYLKSQQNPDGGFPYSKTSSFGSDSDANSTAGVIQALAAAGVDVRGLMQGGNDPLTALVAFQKPNGAFIYQSSMPDDNDLATAQAIPALLLKPLPLKTSAYPPILVVEPAPAAPAPAAPAPARLPTTGGAGLPAWPLAAGLLLLLTGALLRPRHARGR